jgi:hypothetical protein
MKSQGALPTFHLTSSQSMYKKEENKDKTVIHNVHDSNAAAEQEL